nr:hypothetical protein [Arthrobacter sp. MMS18-M83]
MRTLATDMGAYDPASCHNGSVCPDNAVIIVDRWAELANGQLPELFCGFEREQFVHPVP